MPGSIVGGIFGNKAADAQADAAEAAAETQLEMFERSVELSEPWRTGGEGALHALEYELGLGALPTSGGTTSFNVGGQSFSTREEAEQYLSEISGGGGGGTTSGGSGGSPGLIWDDREMLWRVPRPNEVSDGGGGGGGAFGGGIFGAFGGGTPGITESSTGGFEYAGFQETPGYQFNLDEGQRAINRSLAARGKLLSGPAVKEGMRFSQGLADQTYSNHLARLANVAGLGAQTAGQQGAFGMQAGQGMANSLIEGGNARASGYAATGQAIGGALGTLGSIVGAFSDRRLKTDVKPIGETAEGYPKYEFRYIWDDDDKVRVGVMADEMPEGITFDVLGYKVVNYNEVTL